MSYRQITSGERYMLSALRKQGLNQAAIARALGRHRSTISREIRRNRCNDGRYRASKASSRTRGRRSRSRRNRRFSRADFNRIEALLQRHWSPEQICGHLHRHGLLCISHETIYRHIWLDRSSGGTLYTYLRGARKRRRKRYGRYDSRGRLAGKRHISERPKIVERRTQLGHWEIDTVIGKGSRDCLLTLVERKSGYVLIGKLKARSTAQTNQRALKLIRQHLKHFKTITADNGTEFHDYRTLEDKLGVTFYFATPHHSWERGSNENINGLIRQSVPKGTSMKHLTQHDCNRIATLLNTRPRKRHAYKTPKECFDAE